MKFIESKDNTTGEVVKLSYFDYGQGKPVILIHGWPLSKEMWEYQVDALVDAGLRVIAYDRRGFGMSDKPWNGYDYDTLTDDLHAVIEQLDLSDVTLVGFSMGGGEVARYFSRFGGKGVSKAVLVSSVVPYLPKTEDNPDGVPQDVLQDMAQKVAEDRIGFLETFGKQFFGVSMLNHPISAPLMNYYLMLESIASPRATKQCMQAFSYTDFRNDAAAINVPTLIIHGSADKVVPIATSSEKSTKLIPDNQYLVYEGAPHGLFYTEKTKLGQHLATFITEGSASAIEPSYMDTDSVILPSNEDALVTRS